MSNLEMRPVEIDVLRNNSGSDTRQVPASGAMVAASPQGATVTQAVTCSTSSDATVHVANSGRIALGDILTPNTSANILFVKAVAVDGLTLTLRNINPSGAAIALAVGDRLVCTPIAQTVTVGAAIACAHLAITSVALRGPLASDSVAPFGNSSAALTVNSVAGDGLSAALHNSGSEDVILEAGTPMVLATGYMLFIATAFITCPASATTSVPISVCPLANGATVYPHGDLAKPLVVQGYDDATRLLDLQNSTASDISLGASEHLLARATAPVSTDAAGVLRPGGNVATLDSRGHARMYTPETRFDATVTGGGLTSPLLLADKIGGWSRGAPGFINAKDYASIQDAIDALPAEGGTIYIPTGTYMMTDTLYTPCDRPCQLVGEGAAYPGEGGTLLKWAPPEDVVIAMLRLRGNYSSVCNLTLWNTGTATPSSSDESQGFGILLGRRDIEDAHPAPGTGSGNEYVRMGSTPATNLTLNDVIIFGAQGWGLTIPGFGLQSNHDPEPGGSAPDAETGAGGTLSFWVSVQRTRIYSAKKYGACFTGGGCTTIWFTESAFLGEGEGNVSIEHDNYYAYVSGSVQAVFSRCTFEGFSPSAESLRCWLIFDGSESTLIDACWCEEDGRPENAPYSPTYFIQFNGGARGATVRSCHFVRGGNSVGRLRAIQIVDDETTGVAIVEPYGIVASAMVGTAGFKDTAQIDLGAGTNVQIAVLGAGVVRQAAGVPQVYPIQYANAGNLDNIIGYATSKHPVLSDAFLTSDSDGKQIARIGNVVLNDAVGNLGALSVSTGVVSSPWMLANNAPDISDSQRAARESLGYWSDGDIIYNSDHHELQIRIASVWYAFWTKP